MQSPWFFTESGAFALADALGARAGTRVGVRCSSAWLTSFSTFKFAHAYGRGEGMKHYVEMVQEPEFAARELTAVGCMLARSGIALYAQRVVRPYRPKKFSG